MSLFDKLSYISRKRKLELFYKLMKPNAQTKVLDIGGETNPQAHCDLQFIDSYPWKNQVSVINTSAQAVKLMRQNHPQVEAMVGDACQLPWPDKHFDIAYSNAVIEHVGDFEKQKKMAAEVIRVAKRWFITTPNRWYPFEFHLRLPFVTWLPFHGYLWAGKIISYNHVKKKYMFGLSQDGTRLMTAGELRRCFPDSKVIKQRVTFMAETLIVVGPEI